MTTTSPGMASFNAAPIAWRRSAHTRTFPRPVVPAAISAMIFSGPSLRGSSEAELMRNTKVRRILRPFPDTLTPATPIKQVIQRVIEIGDTDFVPSRL
jgi:hypothetical protein